MNLVTRTVAVTITVGSFVRRKLYFAWAVFETRAEVRDTKVQELYGINRYIFQNCTRVAWYLPKIYAFDVLYFYIASTFWK